MSLEVANRLRRDVVEPLKSRFVGRDEVIELIALAVVAGEHLFLYGPPGTAKSALIRHFAQSVNGAYFEYMLTRFSEPNEIFGPVDIARLREGVVATITENMLPRAEFAFLDEIFNANSAILNNLLTVLNERTYRRGAELHHLPLLSLFSASNSLPEDDTLRALFDRFLLRCHVANLPRNRMADLLRAGWELERPQTAKHAVTSNELRTLAAQLQDVDLSSVADLYADTVFKLRDLGIDFSDRRAVKAQKLLAASALLCARRRVEPGDLWVLRYVWDREEQIGPLRALVNGILDRHTGDKAHPLAHPPERVNAETLARELETLRAEVQAGGLSVAGIARLRERLAGVADQCAWVTEDKTRNHLLDRTRELLGALG
ncbi:MAG: AAA family ATPase [Planctomycetes bacterium]|jgi:MoxR-like ATPase|nr:AAA family ATPase [Planctomycetota bacterium]MCL4729536.1 AAA family ATPase [Planctomycetota bacterium]